MENFLLSENSFCLSIYQILAHYFSCGQCFQPSILREDLPPSHVTQGSDILSDTELHISSGIKPTCPLLHTPQAMVYGITPGFTYYIPLSLRA